MESGDQEQVTIEANHEQTPCTKVDDPHWDADDVHYYLVFLYIKSRRNNSDQVAVEDHVAIDVNEDEVEIPATNNNAPPEDFVAIDVKEDEVETPVAIDVKEDEVEVETPLANNAVADPQCGLYALVMYFVTITSTLLSSLAPKIINNKSESPFDAHGGLIIVMAIVSLFTALLASAILVFGSFFLQSRCWMNKNIHYTVFKSVGLLFGLLALYLEILVIFLPRNLNLRVYFVMSITLVMLIIVYYFLWKVVCRYRRKRVNDIWTYDWTFYLGVLPGVLNTSLRYLPPHLEFHITILCIATYVVVLLRYLPKLFQKYW